DPSTEGTAAAGGAPAPRESHAPLGEPGLADAATPDARPELAAPPGPGPFPCLPYRCPLAPAPDKARSVHAFRRWAHPQQPVGGHRLSLALDLQRLDRLGLRRATPEVVREAAAQHLAPRRRPLPPRRHP